MLTLDLLTGRELFLDKKEFEVILNPIYLRLDATNSMSATTLIANLNADLLDGYHASDFLTAFPIHNILDSTYHSDVLTGAITRGDILYGNATPKIARLAKGTAGAILTGDGTDTAWSGYYLAGTAGQTYTFSATGGTVPTGSGTANYLAKWATVSTIGNSLMHDDGTTTSIGVAPVATQILTVKAATTTNTPLVVQTSDNVATKNLTEWQNSSATVLTRINNLGYLGIGAAATYPINVSVDSATLVYGVYVQMNAYKNSGSQIALGFTAACITTAASSESYYGINGITSNGRTNNITGSLFGGQFQAYQGGACTVTTAIGARCIAQADNANAILTNGICADLVLNSTTNGSIVNGYGIKMTVNVSGGGTVTNIYGIYLPAISAGGTLNYAIYTNAGLVRLGDQLSIVGSADRQQFLCTGFSTQSITVPVAQVTRADATAGISAMLGLTALGSGANGDGGSILLNGKSSTTVDQAMGLDQWLWVDATHATRKARRVFNVYDTAVREGLRIEASGTAPMIGFLGHTAAIQQVDGATLTNNVTSGGTDNQIDDFAGALYATDAATIRNDIYQLARKVKILTDALRAFGLTS